jgi:hypothetical protein
MCHAILIAIDKSSVLRCSEKNTFTWVKQSIVPIIKTPFNAQFSQQVLDTLTLRWWERQQRHATSSSAAFPEAKAEQRHGSPAHERGSRVRTLLRLQVQANCSSKEGQPTKRHTTQSKAPAKIQRIEAHF